MNKIYFLVIISISFSLPCFADTDLEESTQQAEYLTAEEMTPEDYAKLSEFAVKYDVCLTKTSQSEINNFDDPRHVVDLAMKQCAYELEELNNWMTEKKIPPPFRQRYIQKTSSRSVGKVLPAVMMGIAARRSAN